jgi:hypothetical protein
MVIVLQVRAEARSIVCPAMMTTKSPAAGIPEGDQVAEFCQEPLVAELYVVCAIALGPTARNTAHATTA